MSRTVDEIHAEMLETISDSYEKTAGYPTYDLTRSIAIVAAGLEEISDDLYNHLDPNNLSGTELNAYTSQHKGISRKEANKAVGQLLVTGTCDIVYGDLFETENGVQFYADNNYSIVDSGTIGIKAVNAGASGNVGANTITLVPVSIPNLNSVTNPSPTTDGYDAESDESLLERYLFALQQPITSNNKVAYKNWALEVTGVGNAKVAPLEDGDNTVSIYIINSNMMPADAALIARVQNYIDPNSSGTGEGIAPMGAYCTVKSAVEKAINISVELSYISGYSVEQVKANVTASINAYLASVNFVSDTVSFARIGASILNSEGVADYINLTVNGNDDNVALDEYEVAVAYITYE